MIPKVRDRAKDVFNAARSLTGDDRLAFVNNACGEDSELRREVEQLLRLHDEGRDTEVDDPTVTTEAGSVSPSHEPGVIVGGHRILQKIGEGGMGEVYRAEQVEPIRRAVALKVIKHGTETREVIARFESERQALALMDHPNVARVFGGGTTGQGRPYFSMEYVKGVPITEYCDRHRLTTEDRLELFTQVCEGVQHAHQKGIIHRDLKPSNVLVTVRDDRAIPKIIDFGVAKATQQRLTESTLFTRVGQLIGTPEYMSPEQAEMTQEDIDTRTDVYSLGVILYELLTGGLPFDSHELRGAGYAEMQRVICEVEPMRPSTRVSTSGGQAAEAAQTRRTDPRTLYRKLRGDLDWITMKALEKDRTRRYETANALALDVQRHIGHLPVRARPPSTRYQLQRFVRRHRLGVIATLLMTLSLLLGVVGTTIGLMRANRERDAARIEAEKAAAISRFLETTFSSPDPRADGREVRVVDVLDRAADRASEEFTGQPEVEAAVRQVLGRNFIGLGEYENARKQFELSVALRELALGREHLDTFIVAGDLVEAVYYLGQLDEAITLQRGLLQEQQEVFGEDHEVNLRSLLNLAAFLGETGDPDEEVLILRDLIPRSSRLLGEDDDVTLVARNNLALTLKRLGRLDEAESQYRETLEIRLNSFGEDDPQTLYVISNLAFLLDARRRYEEAVELHTRVFGIRKRVFGDTHPETLNSMNGIALVYFHQGDFVRAEDYYRRILSLAEDSLDPSNVHVLMWKKHLGNSLFELGRLQDAEQWLLDAFKGLEETVGLRARRTQHTIKEIARLYDDWGRPDEATLWRAKLINQNGASG